MDDLFKEISSLDTEQINQNSIKIDQSSTLEMLKIINKEDKLVAEAVSKELTSIAKAVDLIVESFRNGGRLIYLGAGTSGRLGIIDAAECPPTFGTDPELVQGLIAGGSNAVFKAVEGAEDIEQNGIDDLISLNINKNDIICGLAASGRTPYVLGGLKYANEIGARTIFITTVSKSQTNNVRADVLINPKVGAEVIMGSTRMKSGTAQKLILNMLTTASMVKLGKTYENVMIDLQMNNLKLVERAKKILMNICKVEYNSASSLLNESDGHIKSAILMNKLNINKSEAKTLIKKNNGFVHLALK